MVYVCIFHLCGHTSIEELRLTVTPLAHVYIHVFQAYIQEEITEGDSCIEEPLFWATGTQVHAFCIFWLRAGIAWQEPVSHSEVILPWK